MASGRVLIVHESAGSRALMAELLSREGIAVEAVESSYRGMSRFVEEPAALVVLGLSGISERELEFVRALKAEAEPPRILVSFPAAARDLAVRALIAGAEGYLPEPFYSGEFVALVRANLLARAGAAPTGPDLRQTAREVAHAVNNPLQVVSLLLADEKVHRRKLTEGVAEQVARIREVVAQLDAFGAVAAAEVRPADPRPLIEQAASAAHPHGIRFRVESAALPKARLDERNFADALRALLRAIAARADAGAEIAILCRADDAHVVLTVETSVALLRGEPPAALLEAIFMISPAREVLPGLALPKMLLAAQGAALEVLQAGEVARFVVRLPRAG